LHAVGRQWSGEVHGGFEAELHMNDLSGSTPITALYDRWSVKAYVVSHAPKFGDLIIFRPKRHKPKPRGRPFQTASIFTFGACRPVSCRAAWNPSFCFCFSFICRTHGLVFDIGNMARCGCLCRHFGWCKSCERDLHLAIDRPAGIFLYTAPNVIYNFWEFATDNPIYLDSPGTILAVAVYGVFLTVPSGLALGAYWPQLRKRFLPDDH
jgi:hypothetical protein